MISQSDWEALEAVERSGEKWRMDAQSLAYDLKCDYKELVKGLEPILEEVSTRFFIMAIEKADAMMKERGQAGEWPEIKTRLLLSQG